MGYDLHITRALFWPLSERYPIRPQEVTALVDQETDLALLGPADQDQIELFLHVGDDDWLLFRRGRLSTKNPEPAMIRRMVEIGHLLDAWVVGDDGELYDWEGDVKTSEPTRDEIAQPFYQLVGSGSPRGYSWEAPIPEAAWLDLATAQPDFVVMPWIQARLPSGLAWIPCPPVAYWTGHPSGQPVPFFFTENDHIEAMRDPATLARLRELARFLDARVLDDNLDPA